MLFHTGKDRAHTGIGSDKAIDNCDTHRLAQYTVRIFDGLRRNPLRAVRWLEQPIIKLLNIRLGKFSKRNTAELRLDVRLDAGAIILDGRILFVAAVLLQPEIQPLAQLHLGRFNIRSVIDFRYDFRQLLPDFLLRRAVDGFLDLLAVFIKAVRVSAFPATARASSDCSGSVGILFSSRQFNLAFFEFPQPVRSGSLTL